MRKIETGVNLALLKERRLAAGVTQEELALTLGLNGQNAWSFREIGSVRVPLDEVPVIARELGLDLNDVNEIFFGGKIPAQRTGDV